MITAALVLVALYRIGTVVLQRAICVVAVEGGADSCGWRRVAVAGEVSAWNWRSNVGWRQERAGHELSKAIAGMGHSRGWQPGSKVSMMTIRPPQQGQIFRSSSS